MPVHSGSMWAGGLLCFRDRILHVAWSWKLLATTDHRQLYMIIISNLYAAIIAVFARGLCNSAFISLILSHVTSEFICSVQLRWNEVRWDEMRWVVWTLLHASDLQFSFFSTYKPQIFLSAISSDVKVWAPWSWKSKLVAFRKRVAATVRRDHIGIVIGCSVAHQRSALGAKFDVYDCLVILVNHSF